MMLQRVFLGQGYIGRVPYSSINRQFRQLLSSSALSNEAKSSCKAGTVLNLKMRKSGDEPVALEDHEYPEWLWDSLDKAKMEEKLKQTDFMKWRKKQITKANTARINNSNFLAKMK